jgi:hypothetical protein
MQGTQNRMNGLEYSLNTIGEILILIWTGSPTVQGVGACSAMLTSLRRELSPKKVGFLTIIEPTAGQGTLPAPVRNALGQMLKEHENALQAAAIVFEGSGFRATVVRSVVTAIQMASQLKFRSSVFSDRYTGAAWLMEQMERTTRVTLPALTALLKSKPAATGT